MGSICNISHVNVAVTNANILKYKKKKKKNRILKSNQIIQVLHLRVPGIRGRRSAKLYKGDNFSDSCLLSCAPKLF